MLTPEQLTHLRSQLENTVRGEEERLKDNSHFQLSRAQVKEALRELSNYDNHPADYGSEMFEREKDIALLEHSEGLIREVRRALQAIEDGTYGVCEVCGEDISFERLEALPTALRCFKHADEHIVVAERPIEESILTPPFGQFEYDELDGNFYDAEDAWQEVERYGTSETPSDFYDAGKFDYNEMFMESGEDVGYVEDIEGFILADIHGNYIGINTDSTLHEKYEGMLESADVISILGNPDPVEDYTDREGYVTEEEGERK
ncbi:TraR/DksA C4-type zinc finger protein [Aneurinibacillus tyrosinisolvens]|uniref:TraR/DksA C4-type zinc finger protein n=1 Tax=Aneurinibacillus tyrosinisolvens TaxID=1443435 RepID=UPI00063F0556|nr:TraR/DksA C4-type zinc finger protein [Aneurinibacillus tyrosinisolvens]